MAYSTAETTIGATVIAVAVGFVLFAGSVIGFGGNGGSTQELRASFISADGIRLGTDVRLAGVKIGSVSHMALDKESFRAEVAFVIDEDLKIPDDSGVAISQEGLLGGSYIEILPGASDFALENGGEFLETQGSVSLISLLLRFVAGQTE